MELLISLLIGIFCCDQYGLLFVCLWNVLYGVMHRLWLDRLGEDITSYTVMVLYYSCRKTNKHSHENLCMFSYLSPQNFESIIKNRAWESLIWFSESFLLFMNIYSYFFSQFMVQPQQCSTLSDCNR